ncbi:anaerobic ribonucleoside-triphosphate reductase activating protein [Methanococcus vannielii SB]|jgi:pyruvate formate lyase activating enzyme|uniref:Anaerobic ribonucleoside-triphosphate reductase activating protein n=1 Tax=Methanococcus vannielii (strain ATCC 35089 / DSM 1224 / JCM 13029 / OCM 148 / SB) TaxID=406327 RepID=A6US75_METVS|nr:anaerobic ribonucleoside-triphosphate reductase activating protein [Methanococcus vannielii]ABR55347.1 anaerobic ribonucleoside-triphosphate reductase activating protein [Methanococcus vannielii SB]
MKVSGIVELSTIDYPKHASAVVFLAECNMYCGYCQNYEFITKNISEMSAKEVFESMDLMFADALVISGGEPTLQPEAVKELCKLAKEKNFPVKLDTNGTNPEVIKKLVSEKLIDYVALDVKCSFEKYGQITGYTTKINEKILEIISACKKEGIFIECRTTFIPGLMDKLDITEISKTVKDCDLYSIQKYDSEHAHSEEMQKIKPLSDVEMMELGKIAKEHVKNVIVRTFVNEISIK